MSVRELLLKIDSGLARLKHKRLEASCLNTRTMLLVSANSVEASSHSECPAYQEPWVAQVHNLLPIKTFGHEMSYYCGWKYIRSEICLTIPNACYLLGITDTRRHSTLSGLQPQLLMSRCSKLPQKLSRFRGILSMLLLIESLTIQPSLSSS